MEADKYLRRQGQPAFLDVEPSFPERVLVVTPPPAAHGITVGQPRPCPCWLLLEAETGYCCRSRSMHTQAFRQSSCPWPRWCCCCHRWRWYHRRDPQTPRPRFPPVDPDREVSGLWRQPRNESRQSARFQTFHSGSRMLRRWRPCNTPGGYSMPPTMKERGDGDWRLLESFQ